MSLELEAVHSDMLAQIADKYQKTVGFPAWDFTRAFALAILSLDEDITTAEEHLNVFNLSGLDLDTYIEQHRGLPRKYASYAAATLRVVSGGGEIEAGDAFATESGVEFYAVADGRYSAGDTFAVRAAEGGVSGNVEAGAICIIPTTIAGIGSVTNDAPAAGGAEEEETDDDYRARFLLDLQTPANGANAASYLSWATAISGVGRAKVFPLAQGAGTVEVCVTSAEMEPPDAALIAQVQGAIDPNQNGDGSGAAPIGAKCTVTGCTALTVNVSATLTLESGAADVTEAVKAALTAYLRGVAFVSDYVSYAQVGNAILDVDGVADYAALTINGGTASIALAARQVPKLGTVTLNQGS